MFTAVVPPMATAIKQKQKAAELVGFCRSCGRIDALKAKKQPLSSFHLYMIAATVAD